MTTPRTVDNIGLDISIRYARDSEVLDQKLIEEFRHMPVETQVTVTTPLYSEIEEFIGTFKRNIPWATFSAPPDYTSHKKILFSYQVIPSLGSLETKEEILNKLREYRDNKRKKKKAKRKKEEEGNEEEREKNTLVSLLSQIGLLDKYLIIINSRRSQYHKG